MWIAFFLLFEVATGLRYLKLLRPQFRESLGFMLPLEKFHEVTVMCNELKIVFYIRVTYYLYYCITFVFPSMKWNLTPLLIIFLSTLTEFILREESNLPVENHWFTCVQGEGLKSIKKIGISLFKKFTNRKRSKMF